MAKPEIPQQKPYLVELVKDRTYFWCSCGRSKKQPFCDGSHAGSDFKPLSFLATATEQALLCGCKHSGAPPYCDGAHNNLETEYETASPAEIEATKHVPLSVRSNGQFGKAVLDNGCYVYTPAPQADNKFLDTIGAMHGAKFLAQFEFFSSNIKEECYQVAQSDTALFVLEGAGTLCISGQDYRIEKHNGVLIESGRTFSVKEIQTTSLKLVVSVCPQQDSPPPVVDKHLSAPPATRDPIRLIDNNQRNSMADRFYQVLIGEPQDSTQMTQFIGEIPQSRAAGHRHLYEETLVILRGSGLMWTENAKAEVRPGDTIFLPARQLHSLECTDPDGMVLMGVFYPSGSPAINYA